MIIIPTYNERKNIRPLVGRIRAVLPAVVILFVDDNSPDGTSAEIKSVQAQDPHIRLLTRSGKLGFASAYLEGFKSALADKPELVVIMDADLSHPPEKLPELIALAAAGQVAIGSRYTEDGQVKNWSWQRRLLSQLANFYARVLTKLKVRDATSGFMAIPAGRLEQAELDSIQNRGYAFLIELKVRLAQAGSKFAEVPITFEERKEGESKLNRSIVLEGMKYPFKLFLARQIQENYPAWLIFFISLAVYAVTLPRAIYFGDSAEFMASALTLGIPHPSGYPTYVLLAKLFTFIPLGSPEFRVGLFSAVSAAASLAVFYFLLLRILFAVRAENKNLIRGVSVVAAFILGFSNLFWSQAIMAKVYAPLTLCVLLLLLLTVKFWETNQPRYLVWAMFLLGFGAGIHEMILLFSPIIIFAVAVYLWQLPKIFDHQFDFRPVFIGLAVFLLGLGTFAYLPIRDRQPGNFYNFAKIFFLGRPGQSLDNFKNYVLRSDYADYGGQFSWKDKIAFFSASISGLASQFYWLLIFLPVGLLWLWFKNKKFFVLTLAVFALNILGIILLRSVAWNLENEFLSSFYYLPAYSVAALWLGLGLAVVMQFFYSISKKNLSFLPGLLLILPLGLVAVNLSQNNLSKFQFVSNYTAQVLDSLPPHAVLLAHYLGANTDTLLFGYNYQQTVRRLRPDVTILTIDGIYPQVERRIVAGVYNLADPKNARYYLTEYALKAYPGRPIYTTYLTDRLSDKKTWTESSNGLVYQLSDQGTPPPAANNWQLDWQKDLSLLQSNLYGQDLLAQYFYTQAAFWAAHQDLVNTQSNFINGIKYDYKVSGMDQADFIIYRNKVIGK